MSTNDTKIRSLLTAIETKRNALGAKPRTVLLSNGILKDIPGHTTVNLNTLNDMDKVVSVTAEVLRRKSARNQAEEFLGVEQSSTSDLDNYLTDLKMRASIIQWQAEDKKLKAMESQLKDLRSEDAKTEDALADIAALLG